MLSSISRTISAVCLKKAMFTAKNRVSIKCTSCNEVHTSSENGNETELWFPNHSMVQIIKGAISRSRYFCHVHQQEKNHYCFNDNTLVCIYCAFHGEHLTHTCKHQEDARKEAHKILSNITVSTHVSDIERQLQLMKDEKELLRTQETSVYGMVEELYEQLKATLQKQKELLCEEIKNQMSKLNSNVDANTL